MKIGLYFGSFNPIHHGHLIIGRYILNETDIERVWYIVSPQNPLKETKSLLAEQNRYYLTQLALEDEPLMKASNIEFAMPRPSYTIDTLTYLSDKYPQHQFVMIMGADSMQNIEKWKNYQEILRKYEILIYPRPEHTYKKRDNTFEVQAPLLEISSTQIRKMVAEKKSIRFFVPDAVAEYIEQNRYYK